MDFIRPNVFGSMLKNANVGKWDYFKKLSKKFSEQHIVLKRHWWAQSKL